MKNVVVHRRRTLSCAMAVSVLLVSAIPTLGQGKAERVQFRRSHSAAMMKGRILGFDTKEYLIGARAGQVMTLRLSSGNLYANFVIYSINGRPTDMNERTQWSEKLSESGEYLIRVFMMRAGARRKGAAATYTLNVSVQ